MTLLGELFSPEKAIIEYAGQNAFARLSWLKSGGPVDWDTERFLKDWHQGAKAVSEELSPLTVAEALEKITAVHAETIWIENGAVRDPNLARMQSDWDTAKRYIAYLIADDFVTCCLDSRYETKDDCYNHLREEYLDYLLVLPVEEFIRIKAYFTRQADINAGVSHPPDHYYFQAEKELYRSRRHCKRLVFPARVKKFSEPPTSYLLDNCELTKVANRKEFTLNRLRLNSTMVQEYIDTYYPTVNTAVKRLTEGNRQPLDMYDFIRADKTAGNMLEFFLRCAICAAIPLEEYEKQIHFH